MAENSANLAALIGSRICHDLISSIGAINNGLELLELSGGAQGAEMELIADSAANAGARIRFFRIAFGTLGDQMLGRAEVASVLADITHGTRLTINWYPTAPQPRGAVRLAFLAFLCCETAMPYGGTVSIDEVDDHWQVTGVAEKVNVDSSLWGESDTLAAPADPVPAHVQFALLPIVATDIGRRVMVRHDAMTIRISF